MAYVTLLSLSGTGSVSTGGTGTSGTPFVASSIIAIKGIAGAVALSADVYVGASSAAPAVKIATLKAAINSVDFMSFTPDGIEVSAGVDQATVVFNDTDANHLVYIYWK